MKFNELTPKQQDQVNTQFSATIGKQSEYIYEIGTSGVVLSRRRMTWADCYSKGFKAEGDNRD